MLEFSLFYPMFSLLAIHHLFIVFLFLCLCTWSFLLMFASLFLYTELSVDASFIGHVSLWYFGRHKHFIGNSHQPSFRKPRKRVFVFTHTCVGRIISSQCDLVLFLFRKWPLVIPFGGLFLKFRFVLLLFFTVCLPAANCLPLCENALLSLTFLKTVSMDERTHGKGRRSNYYSWPSTHGF